MSDTHPAIRAWREERRKPVGYGDLATAGDDLAAALEAWRMHRTFGDWLLVQNAGDALAAALEASEERVADLLEQGSDSNDRIEELESRLREAEAALRALAEAYPLSPRLQAIARDVLERG